MFLRVSIAYHDGTSTGFLRLTTGQGHYDGTDFYEPRLSEAFNLQRTLYEPGKTSGESKIGLGAIKAKNADGGLDHIKNYGFDGREVVVQAAETESGPWDTLFKGTIEQAEIGWSDVTFRLRDPLARLDVPVQGNLFAEHQEDIDGKPIPLTLGDVRNVESVCIDPGLLIYQVHDGPIEGVGAVYDDGNALGQNVIADGEFNFGDEYWTPNYTGVFTISNGILYFNQDYPNHGLGQTGSIKNNVTGGCAYTLSANLLQFNPNPAPPSSFFILEIIYESDNHIPEVDSFSYTSAGMKSENIEIPSWCTYVQISLVMGGNVYQAQIDDVFVIPIATDHPTRADLEAALIPSGGYHTCLDEGLFRLGSNPSGTITCDITGARNLTPNLVTNGGFDTDLDWAKGAGWSIADGLAAKTPGTADWLTQHSLPGVSAGDSFLVTFDISGRTAGTVMPQFSGRPGSAIEENGGQAFESTTVNNTGNLGFSASADFDGSIDNVKLWLVSETAPTSVASMMNLLLLSKGILDASEIDAVSIAALDALNPAPAGIYITSENRTVISVLDELAGSIGAWWHFGRSAGTFTCGRFDVPGSGEAAALDVEDHNLEISRIATMDEGKGVPAWKVNLRHTKNYTVQVAKSPWDISNVAGVVSEARRAFIGQEWRTLSAEDMDVQTMHLLAPELEFESLLTDSAAAQAEVARLLSIYAGDRDRFKVRVPMSVVSAAGIGVAVDLGDAVRMTGERMGLGAGKYFIVIGMTETYGQDLDTVELDLYG